MAEPSYAGILQELITILRATKHYRHVGIDEQLEASALQCPAVLVSMPRVRWEVVSLSGGVTNDRAPFWIYLTFALRLCVFSAQGPADAVTQRATLLQTLVTDLRTANSINGKVVLSIPTEADLPEPVQDQASLWARALLVLEARLLG